MLQMKSDVVTVVSRKTANYPYFARRDRREIAGDCSSEGANCMSSHFLRSVPEFQAF